MELDNLKTIWKEQEIPAGDDPLQTETLALRFTLVRLRRQCRLHRAFSLLMSAVPSMVIKLQL